MTLALLASCSSVPPVEPVAGPPAEPTAWDAPPGVAPPPAAPTPLLVMSDVSPGELVHLRVSGARPGDSVTVMVGAAGPGPCPPRSPCLGIVPSRALVTAIADPDGQVRVDVPVAGVPIGGTLAFQALGVSPVAGYVTNVVVRTVEPPADYTVPPGGNVLVVVLDDVGVDKFARYGFNPDAPPTPAFDALADSGVLFENAYAYPLCAATRAALHTGRYGRRTGVGGHIPTVTTVSELALEETLLPEMVELTPWGTYATGLSGKWHLSTHISPSGAGHAVLQGFDAFEGVLGNLNEALVDDGRNHNYYHWELIVGANLVGTNDTYVTTVTTDSALQLVGTLPEPWLIEVAYNAPHLPFQAPPPMLHPATPLDACSTSADVQDAMLEAADLELARLLASIPAPIRDRTTIFVFGDNGSPSSAIRPPYGPGRAKGTIFDGGTRVPFVVSGPAVAAPGRTSSALVHVVDVFPTIADLVGMDLDVLPGVVDPATPVVIDGRSFLPVLMDPAAPPPRTELFTERFAPNGAGPFASHDTAIRDDRYKLVRDMITGVDQFFEYAPGPDEGMDLLHLGLDATQQAAYDRLAASLEATEATLAYEREPWLSPPPDTSLPPEDTAVDTDPPPVPPGCGTADTGGAGGSGGPAGGGSGIP